MNLNTNIVLTTVLIILFSCSSNPIERGDYSDHVVKKLSDNHSKFQKCIKVEDKNRFNDLIILRFRID